MRPRIGGRKWNFAQICIRNMFEIRRDSPATSESTSMFWFVAKSFPVIGRQHGSLRNLFHKRRNLGVDFEYWVLAWKHSPLLKECEFWFLVAIYEISTEPSEKQVKLMGSWKRCTRICIFGVDKTKAYIFSAVNFQRQALSPSPTRFLG